MDINRQNMNELFLGFQQVFKRGFETADIEYRKFSTEVVRPRRWKCIRFLNSSAG